MSEKLWWLKCCELFARLTNEEMRRIESRSRCRSFAARTPIQLPADKTDSVFLLTSGLAKICHLTPDGKESIIAFVGPGELFGELAIFGDHEGDEYVEAVEASTVVMIPAEEMRSLAAERHDVALGISKIIGLRRRRIERRLKSLLFLSNRQRLAHLLLDLAEQFGVQEGNKILLQIRLSHQELASLIGSTRETVTVILGQLRTEGIMGGGRRKIVLVDPQRLARSVGRQPPCLTASDPHIRRRAAGLSREFGPRPAKG